MSTASHIDTAHSTDGFSLAIHGGAGTIDETVLSDEARDRHHGALAAALTCARAGLADGGDAIDAVETAVRHLEDCPLFNAGHGACLSHDRHHELDAAIMNGATRACGAVAGIRTARHPVSAARAVMQHSAHVLLAGVGADEFAAHHALEIVDNSWFSTPLREDQWQQVHDQRTQGDAAEGDMFRFGTVGAVARDRYGHLAAATSTGGVTFKRWGRIGDSPLIGAGTLADDTVAVSCSGSGELFIRHSVAHEISARLRLTPLALEAILRDLLDGPLAGAHGHGGMISIDAQGRIALGFNTLGMYRGWTCASSNELHTASGQATRRTTYRA